jgi:hypothetical protein
MAIAIMLGSVSAAPAAMHLFLTSSAQSYGLTDPNLAFLPTVTFTQPYDSAYYQIAAFPPLSAFDDTPVINWYLGQFAYLWGRFVDEPTTRKTQSIHLSFDDSPTDVAYYVMNDISGPAGLKRWDGAFGPPNAPEFKLDPQILAAVAAYGVHNHDVPGDEWNLYDYTTRTFLLGAVRYDRDGMFGLDQVGIKFANILTPPSVSTRRGQWVPEPGSALLLGAAVLLGRGRRSRL